jgi:hypothetical protein
MAAAASAQSIGLDTAVERVSSAIDRAVGGAFGQSPRGEASREQEAQSFEWAGRVPAGGSLEIKGVNGAIIVERASGSEAAVSTTARGRRSDASSVRIEMIEHDGGLTFCAVYPSAEDERENFCGAGSEGRMNTNRNDVEVEFRVQVPAGVRFVGRTVNGDVEALALESDVQLVTVNGDLEVSTSGYAEAETVNGSIEASMERAPADGLSFSTVNGDITLDLPDDIDAELDASWLNGELDSALPVMLQGRMGRRSARGTLGDGGPRLEVSTVNGSIRLR